MLTLHGSAARVLTPGDFFGPPPSQLKGHVILVPGIKTCARAPGMDLVRHPGVKVPHPPAPLVNQMSEKPSEGTLVSVRRRYSDA